MLLELFMVIGECPLDCRWQCEGCYGLYGQASAHHGMHENSSLHRHTKSTRWENMMEHCTTKGYKAEGTESE